MRHVGAILLSLALMTPALAQPASAPKPAPAAKPAAAAKPNPVTDAYAAMPEAERLAIQSDLIWTGDYAGTLTPEFGTRAIAAAKAFQKQRDAKDTGILSAPERAALAAAAKPKREAVGWRVVADTATGTRLGIPAKLTPQSTAVIGGSRWTAPRGEVQVDTFRIAAPDVTLAANFEQQQQVSDRKVSYKVLRPEFYVVSGLQGTKKFYVRAASKDGEIRGFAILFDQTMEATVDPVVIAMSSAFIAFPADVAVVPPPRKRVEYGTGVVMDSAGHVVTTQELIEACKVVTLAVLGPADLVATDEKSGLALLQVHGAHGLTPLALAQAVAEGDVTLAGIADPQAQGGLGAVSVANARITPTRAGSRPTVEPTPTLGFSGAAVVGRDGKLAGIVDLRPQVVAGPAGGGPRANLIAAGTIAKFLQDKGIAIAATEGSAGGAKEGVVRVICVR